MLYSYVCRGNGPVFFTLSSFFYPPRIFWKISHQSHELIWKPYQHVLWFFWNTMPLKNCIFHSIFMVQGTSKNVMWILVDFLSKILKKCVLILRIGRTNFHQNEFVSTSLNSTHSGLLDELVSFHRNCFLNIFRGGKKIGNDLSPVFYFLYRVKK